MKKVTFLLFTVIALASCRKQPDLSKLSDDFIVATPHDVDADFSEYKTYYISDTIAIVNTDKPNDSIWTDSNAKQLIDQIKKNMNARGFVFTPLSGNPDLVIPTVGVKITTDVYYGGYYWGYPGYWDPWYYGGYYYYYPYYYSYSYTSGAFVFELADRKNIAANNGKINLIWTGFLGGYLNDYTSTNIANALPAIDQAFSQSEYLKASN